MSSLKELHANSNIEDFEFFKAAASKAPAESELGKAFKTEGSGSKAKSEVTKAHSSPHVVGSRKLAS